MLHAAIRRFFFLLIVSSLLLRIAIANQLSESEIVQLAKSVVKVVTTDKILGSRSSTGFVWSENKYVVTTYHSVAAIGEHNISVLYPGKGSRTASVIGIDINSDLALLEVTSPPSVAPLILRDIPDNESREYLVVGYPKGAANPIDRTVVRSVLGLEKLGKLPSSLRSAIQNIGFPSLDLEVLTLDGSVSSGDSGSPVIDANGNVVGIADGGLGQGVFWAIPADTNLREIKKKNSNPDISLVSLKEIEAFYSQYNSLTTAAIKRNKIIAVQPFKNIPESIEKSISADSLSTILFNAGRNTSFLNSIDSRSGSVDDLTSTLTPFLSKEGDKIVATAVIDNPLSSDQQSVKATASASNVNYENLFRDLWKQIDIPTLLAAFDHRDDIKAIIVSPNGSVMATVDDTGLSKIWNIKNGEWLGDIAGVSIGFVGPILRFSDTGRYIIAGLESDTQIVWDIDKRETVMETDYAGEYISNVIEKTQMVISHASGETGDEAVLARQIQYGEISPEPMMVHYNEKASYATKFTDDFNHIIIQRTRLSKDEFFKDFEGLDGNVYEPDDKYELWARGADDPIKVVNGVDPRIVDNAVISLVENNTSVLDLTTYEEYLFKGFYKSIAGNGLLTTLENSIYIWNVSTKEEIASFSASTHVNYADLTEDGHVIASTASGIEIFDALSGVEKANFPNAHFSPYLDSKQNTVALISSGTLHVYHLEEERKNSIDISKFKINEEDSMDIIGFMGNADQYIVIKIESGNVLLVSVDDGETRVLSAQAARYTYSPGTNNYGDKINAKRVHRGPVEISSNGSLLLTAVGQRALLYSTD